MTTVVVWVLFVFHTPADRMPSPGIFSYETKVACEERATSWRHYACVRVEVPKPR